MQHITVTGLDTVGTRRAVEDALAAVGRTRPPARPPALPPDLGVPGPRSPEWESSLDDLLDTGAAPAARPMLAVELELRSRSTVGRPGAAGPAPMLAARLLRPGRSGWSGHGTSWDRLAVLRRQVGYRGAAARVLQELFALLRCSDPAVASSLGHAYGEVPSIDLAAIESRALWNLLDQAARLDIPLLRAGTEVGAFGHYDEAEVVLDVTDDPDGVRVTPVLRIEGLDGDVVPVRFVGDDGHGVVHVPVDEAVGDPSGGRPQLARLRRPVPSTVQEMLLAGEPLEIPSVGRERFRTQFAPRLRHRATLVSSDGSFTPPTVVGPTLVLRAGYGADHELSLSWEFAYEVDGTPLRAPLTRPGPVDGYRDGAAEQRVVDAVGVPLERYGLHLGRRDPREPLRLTGFDTMRFTTDVLPLLRDAADVRVEIVGEPAEYREAGDSLQIGVSTDEVAGAPDWFDLGITVTVEGREIPFAQLLAALASHESHLLLSDGAWFSLERPELDALRRLVEEARALQDAPDGPLRLSRFQAGLWDELTEVCVVERQAVAWREQVAGLLALDRADAAEPPSSLCGELRPYQRDGFVWLAFLWQARLGGILADDMGLGKTVQTLALICHAQQADPGGDPFLIVAPTSVVPNWVAEARRFAPHLTVVAITDTLRRRGQDLAELVEGADVVVTSYTLFRLDAAAHRAAGWAGLILDEAQVVKNHRSKVHQCARALPAPFKLAITGTPMENNLLELWALFAITAPGLLGSPGRFREYYAVPIEKGTDPERPAQLRRRIAPLMTRRTKELVAADLPAKQEQVLEVDLDPKHRTIYERHLQRERQKILGLLDDVDGNRFLILKSLTLLRRLSLHAGFADERHRDVPSSKIETLVEHLDDVIDGGHRALVFSQFTGYLAHVRARLDAAGIAYCYLDGATRDREAVVRAFKEGDAPVFLISLKAGGSGLNLPEADYCFLLDPWWNPATEAQAVDRAHRIGQTRTVIAYRLIARDTIEEKVMALKARKAALFAGVVQGSGSFKAGLDADDIRSLLG